MRTITLFVHEWKLINHICEECSREEIISDHYYIDTWKRHEEFYDILNDAKEKYLDNFEYEHDIKAYKYDPNETYLEVFCKKHNTKFDTNVVSHRDDDYGQCPNCREEKVEYE